MDINEVKQIFRDNKVTITKDDAWAVQGSTLVVKHKALERLAAAFKLVWDMPVVVRAERDEAVILCRATRPDTGVSEFSFGEALVNVNYRISGKQAGYVYAMAEKRAKDRVILKLCGLHGVYSEEENEEDFARKNRTDGGGSDEQPAERQTERQSAPASRPAVVEEPPHEDGPDLGGEELMQLEGELKKRIDEADTIRTVTDLMLTPEIQGELAKLPANTRDAVRDYAKARLVSLGWPKRAGRAGQQAAA